MEQEAIVNKTMGRPRRGAVDLTQRTIFKHLLFQQLYNTVDSLVVGRFAGHTALAAGATSSVSYLLIGFFMGMGTGAGVVASRYYGAKDHEKLEKSVHTSIAISLLQ